MADHASIEKTLAGEDLSHENGPSSNSLYKFEDLMDREITFCYSIWAAKYPMPVVEVGMPTISMACLKSLKAVSC